MEKKNKVALVHDFLTGLGGAENVLRVIAGIYKDSDVFTLISDKKILQYSEFDWIRKRFVYPSFLQYFPKFLKRRRKLLLPFMPTAIETLDLRDYDLVISSSGAFSKGIVVKSKTLHVCYMHSPLRYVWDWSHRYIEENNLKGGLKFFTRFFLSFLRLWDRASSQRPDYLIANSKFTQSRIKKYYNRDSEVIYPPVEVDDFQVREDNKGYFLTVARLSAYKQVDVLIEAFDKLGLPLVVVGDGVEKRRLEKKIENSKNSRKMKLVGEVERTKLVKLYENARAFVFACQDDFGIAPVEAMAAGKPVIALRDGGVVETVIEGETGEFFEVTKSDEIVKGVEKFIKNENKYKPKRIRQRAEEFSRERFEVRLVGFIEKIKKINS